MDQDLVTILASMSREEDVSNFLNDLLTPQERRAMTERLNIARRLEQGQMSYREISAETGASVTTITRVARFLKDEPYQGYRVALDILKDTGKRH
jgi:Trp operon repressor